ncbi:MAG: NosD domain-containing protein [Promethearchaeota archaeon]
MNIYSKKRSKANKGLILLIFLILPILINISSFNFQIQDIKDSSNTESIDKKGEYNVEDVHPSGGIIGEDDRILVDDTTVFPYRTISKLKGVNASGTYDCGTAFIIDKFQALTAAHCVWEDGKYRMDEFFLVPGFDDYNEPYGRTYVTNIRIESEYKEHEWMRYDWAYLTLDRNIGSVTGWMGIQTASYTDDIYKEVLSSAGYPSNKSNGNRMYKVSDKGSYATQSLHYFKLDVTSGQSGSPLWRYDAIDDANYVLTVVAYSGIFNNFGTRINNARFQKILDWIDSDSLNPPIDYPDLVFRGSANDYKFSPKSIKPGSEFNTWCNIKNEGTASTNSFKVAYYASENNAISTSDYLLGVDTISSLAPFQIYNSSISISFPFIPTRYYYVGMIIDYENEIVEHDERNTYLLLDHSYELTDQLLVKPSIKVTNPSNKDVWVAETAQEITWLSTSSISNVEIKLIKTGSTILTITSNTVNDGSYTWMIPQNLDLGSDYTIRIKDKDGDTYDESDCFTILSQMPFFQIYSPTIISNWEAGSTHTIRWDPVPSIQEVSIVFIYPDHSHRILVPRMSNQGEYIWDIPDYLPSRNDYQIAIVDTSDHSRYGISGAFTIQELPKTIHVTSPGFGRSWERGNTYPIIWSSTGPISDVEISLIRRKIEVATISSSTSNAGYFMWLVPRTLTINDQYLIEVIDIDNDEIFDSSIDFEIVEDSTPPEQPILMTPAHNKILRNDTPYFDWTEPLGDPVGYEFQVSSDISFIMPLIDTYLSLSEITLLASLYDGIFYWRVRAKDEIGNWGAWSTIWSFTIDKIGPLSPDLLSPGDGTIINNYPINIEWSIISEAVTYWIQIDNFSNSFNSIVYEKITQNTQTSLENVSDSTYFWRIRAKDEVGNWGAWSTTYSFIILDSDNDGIPDIDENLIYGTDPFLFDTDGDGLGDGEEILNLGSDPLNYMDPVNLPLLIEGDATGIGAHNWMWAENQPWCTGSGTWNDPYIIKNLSIDGQGVDNCIEIRNSNVFFIIRNTTLYGASSADYRAAIHLVNVNNSLIIENNCSNNGHIGIILYENCYNNTIKGNLLHNNDGAGISLRYSLNNTIRDNWIANSTGVFGVYFLQSHYTRFINNTVQGCSAGIRIHATEHTIVSNNVFERNQVGISLRHGHYSRIYHNTLILSSNHGIFSDTTALCDIHNNVIYNTTYDGIRLIDNSRYNEIYSNEIRDSSRYGVNVDDTNVHNNSFYQNHFIDNNVNALDDGTDNYWDNGSIGNYWSDYWDTYLGVDLDDDGIGDIPYNIEGSAGNQDRYPIWDDGPEDNHPPTWDQMPTDQTLEFGIPFLYDVNASDLSGIDHYWISDTTNFQIDGNGIITNVGTLSTGIYPLEIRAFDPYNNFCTETIEITIFSENVPPQTPEIPGFNFSILLLTIGILSICIILQMKKKQRRI